MFRKGKEERGERHENTVTEGKQEGRFAHFKSDINLPALNLWFFFAWREQQNLVRAL